MVIRLSGKLTIPQGKLTMVPTLVEPAGGNFKAQLYTGNNGSNSITGVGFQPDLLWAKNYSPGGARIITFDSERGADERLYPDLVNAESTAGFGQTFDANGFSWNTSDDDANANTESYVGWCWQAGSQYLDIVSYSGDGNANQTIAHNLGATPSVVIVKRRNASGGWRILHPGIGLNQYLAFDDSNLATTDATIWDTTAPTGADFTVGSDATVNASGGTYIAYLFGEVEGASKFGIYTGNGIDGLQTTGLGFDPSMVMVKISATGSTADWHIGDSSRGDANTVLINSTAGGLTSSSLRVNMISDGFEVGGGTAVNQSGSTYTYFAWA